MPAKRFSPLLFFKCHVFSVSAGLTLYQCVREENIDYRAGSILVKDNSTEQGCAELAAKTVAGNFWTFKAQVKSGGKSTSRCWVRRTNKGRRRQPGLVSGNRACGVSGTLRVSPIIQDRFQSIPPSYHLPFYMQCLLLHTPLKSVGWLHFHS